MLLVLIGVIIGWLLASFVMGFSESHKYYRWNDMVYKHVAGVHDKTCVHELFAYAYDVYDIRICHRCNGLYIRNADITGGLL